MSLQYLKKEGRDKVYYLNGKKHQLFYRLIRLILVDMTRHSQIIQSNKFTKFFDIPRKKWGMKLNFCTDEFQSFLQIDAIISGGHG